MRELVLAGISGPPAESRAVDAAIEEARIRKWPLHLVSVFPASLVSDPSVDIGYVARKNREGLTLLKEAARRAGQCGVEATIEVESGDPRHVLTDSSAHAGLLVIGKQGKHTLSERVLGGVASWLAAHAKCPTLVVPSAQASEPVAQADGNGYRGMIVAAVDGRSHQSALVRSAAREAKLHGKPLGIVHVCGTSENDEARAAAESMLKELSAAARELHPEPASFWEVRSGSATDVLIEMSRTADMLVLGTRGHSGLPGLFLGSVSQGVLHGTETAVLVERAA